MVIAVFCVACPFAVFAYSDVEAQLCYINIERAYEQAKTSGEFTLEDADVCGKYKSSYDLKYRPQTLPEYEGEDEFSGTHLPLLQEETYRLRDACMEKIETAEFVRATLDSEESCIAFFEALEALPK